jgi:predicted hydrolase (HD superfamily)
MECEQLGLTLDEFIDLALAGFRKIADQIDL